MSSSLSREFANYLPQTKDIYFHHVNVKSRFPVQLIYLSMRNSLFLYALCLGAFVRAQNANIPLSLDQLEATRLIHLPLKCMETEYPNKLGQVLGSASD